jgi:hypothetical protein
LINSEAKLKKRQLQKRKKRVEEALEVTKNGLNALPISRILSIILK